MKKFFTIAGGIILIVAIVYLIAGFMGPHGFSFKRSIVINAPRAVIYQKLTDYSNMTKWSPWEKYDSTMTTEIFGTQGQIGAGYKWKGNDMVGEGQMTTVGLKENEKVTIQLTFLKPIKSTPMSEWLLEDAGEGMTKATWSFDQTDIPFVFRPLMLFMNMDKTVGADYERGLANLKKLCESEPKTSTDVKEVI